MDNKTMINAAWDKKNTITYQAKTVKTTERDVVEIMDAQTNKSGFIKQLIRASAKYLIVGVPTDELKELYFSKDRNALLNELTKNSSDVGSTVLKIEEYKRFSFFINSDNIAFCTCQSISNLKLLKKYFQKIYLTATGDYVIDSKNREAFEDKLLSVKL